MTTPDQNERLERAIDRALRNQPLRRAPPTLKSRVMLEVARRAARPWWQQSFTTWPRSARVLFLISSYGFVRLTLWIVAWARATVAPVASAAALPVPLARVNTELNVTGSVIKHLWLGLQSIPPQWLDAALVAGVALYGASLALVATAYHVLYIKR